MSIPLYLPGVGLLDHARVHFVTHAEPAAGAPVPDVTVDLLGWFDFFDSTGSGSLSQEQIVRALVSSFFPARPY